MRATRAYIAGIGTSGVLLAFAALLLIVLGALLGFRGWPGEGTAQGVDSLVIEEPDRPLSVARVAASGPAAEGGRSPGAPRGDRGPAGPAGREGGQGAGSGAPLTGSTGGSGGDRVGGGGGPIGPEEGAPSTSPVSPPRAGRGPDLFDPARPVDPGRGISPLTNVLGGSTRDLSQDLGVQVAPLSPPLGGVVRDGGGLVGGGLIDLGNAGDGVLRPVDPTPLPLPLPLPVQAPVPSR